MKKDSKRYNATLEIKRQGLQTIKTAQSSLKSLQIGSVEESLISFLASIQEDFHFDPFRNEEAVQAAPKNATSDIEMQHSDSQPIETAKLLNASESKRNHSTLKNDSIVWAKLPGYPWFPGKMQLKHRLAPAKVLQQKRRDGSILINFYDGTWGWVSSEKLQPFNGRMLETSSKKSKNIKSSKEKLLEAFQLAMRDYRNKK
jgi:hypothetical protein